MIQTLQVLQIYFNKYPSRRGEGGVEWVGLYGRPLSQIQIAIDKGVKYANIG